MHYLIGAACFFQIAFLCLNLTPVICIIALSRVYDFAICFFQLSVMTIEHTDKLVHLLIKAIELLSFSKTSKLRRNRSKRRNFISAIHVPTIATAMLNVVNITHLGGIYRPTARGLVASLFSTAIMMVVTFFWSVIHNTSFLCIFSALKTTA